MKMTYFTSTNAPIDIAISAMGNSLQSFSSQQQGRHIHWKEIFGTFIILALGGYALYQVITGMNYLGITYYIQERLHDLFWGIIWIGLIVYRVLHLKKVFSTRGEIFAKGCYLKYGASEYVYAFTDIAHLQKTLVRGTHHNIHTASLTFLLVSGEHIKIHSTGDEIMIQFADALGVAYAKFRQHEMIEQFKKGEKIGFGLFDIDKTYLYYQEQQLPRAKISEIKKARSERYLLVLDEKGEKLAKWDVNKIWDEELFFLLYEKFFPGTIS